MIWLCSAKDRALGKHLSKGKASDRCRRIKTEEPEDSKFPLRRRIDFEFLIYSLIRLRKTAALAASILGNNSVLEKALKDFDSELPDITKMRNVLEHFEEYAIDRGRNIQISRKELEASSFSPISFEWLGEKLDTEKVLHSCQKLYGAIKDSTKIKKDK